MRKSCENGRSMVEMLGVLAIIGVLSVGGIAGYSKAMFKYKMSNTLDIISGVVANIVELDSKKTGPLETSDGNDMITYGLMPDCKLITTIDDVISCETPLGYIHSGITTSLANDVYGYLYIGLIDNALESCIGILSYHFENVVPQYLWGDKGYISVTPIDGSIQQSVWTLCDENKTEGCLILAPISLITNEI